MFFDLFFWVCITLVSLAAFVDWLLRPHERRKIKGGVYLFWESIKERTLLAFVIALVHRILATFRTFTMCGLPSKRSLRTFLFLSPIVAAVIVYHTLFSPGMRQFFDMHWSFAVGVTIPYLFFTLFFCFVSLLITIFFLNKMALARSIDRIAALSLFDITLALIVGFGSYALAYFFAQWFTDIFLRLFGWQVVAPFEKYWINVVNSVRSAVFEANFNRVNFMMFLLSFIPSLIYVLAILSGVILFVLEKPIRPLSLRFFEALLREEKGIITIVAGGMGVIAKSVQELLKAV